ncbi:hypothetical protein ABEF93_006092 [Exophiala dermatitidis]
MTMNKQNHVFLFVSFMLLLLARTSLQQQNSSTQDTTPLAFTLDENAPNGPKDGLYLGISLASLLGVLLFGLVVRRLYEKWLKRRQRQKAMAAVADGLAMSTIRTLGEIRSPSLMSPSVLTMPSTRESEELQAEIYREMADRLVRGLDPIPIPSASARARATTSPKPTTARLAAHGKLSPPPPRRLRPSQSQRSNASANTTIRRVHSHGQHLHSHHSQQLQQSDGIGLRAPGSPGSVRVRPTHSHSARQYPSLYGALTGPPSVGGH